MADGESIERLVVEFHADNTKILEKLSGLNRAVHGSAKQIEKDISEINVEEAFKKVFDSSKLTILDAGAEHLRVFGSALEPLGPLGIGAAAGIALVGLAAESGAKALEFAEGLEKASQKLGVSTSKLQEYDYLAMKSGVATDEFRAAILKSSEAFGAYISGVGDAKVKKAFAAIGITPEQAQQLGDLDHALPVIADKIKAVGNAAEQNKLAKMLGMEELLPALRQGGDYIVGMQQEAHKLGLVLDAGAVKEAAELAGQMKIAEKQVSQNLMRAFLNLTPVIMTITNFMAKMARLAADTAETLSSIDPTKLSHLDYRGYSEDHLARVATQTKKGMADQARIVMSYGGHIDLKTGMAEGGAPAANAGYNALRARWLQLGGAYGEKKKSDAAIDAEETASGAAKFLGVDKEAKARRGPKGPRDNGAELSASGLRTLDEAQKAYASAQASLTSDILAHAAFEKQVVADELKTKSDELDAQQAKIAADKGISAAKKKELVAQLEQARQADALAALAKDTLIDREASFKLEDREIEVHTAKITSLLAQLQDEADMAATSSQRKAIERRILEIRQQQEHDLLTQHLDRRVKTGELAPEQAAAIAGADSAKQAADMRKSAYDSTYGGVKGALEAAIHGGWPGLAKYMADKLETNLVDALANSLTNSLIGAGGGGGQQNLFSALFAAIPGFATGTDSAPGGLSLVGEKGPELVNLQKGAKVTPNSQLSNLQVGRGMSVSVYSPSFDLRGAVMTSDLLSQMSSMAAAAEQRATVNGATLGAQAARSIIPGEMNRRAGLQIR